MDNDSYRPRLLVVFIIIVVAAQIFIVNYLQRDFDRRIQQCYEAINTNSVLQGALINVLEKKGVLSRQDVLREAGTLSADIREMLESYAPPDVTPGEKNPVE